MRISLKALYAQAKAQGISMQRRFILCILSVLFSVIAIFLLLLNLFGVMQPANAELSRALTQQLEYSADRLGSDMEQLAAAAAAFSNEMSDRIAAQGLSFDALQNNQEALLSLQVQTYPTVYNFMQRRLLSAQYHRE